MRELSLGERMKMELIAVAAAPAQGAVPRRADHRPRRGFAEDRPRIPARTTTPRSKTTILLTSHYMADIQELCERVIIIDHGTIFFDGRLSEVVDRFADFKLITIQCDERGKPAPASSWRNTAKSSSKPPASIQLKVKRDRVIPVCKALLDELPVRDIDIQEVPIEDVIRKIFAREPKPAG
ncbi:MAG: hypothetical protein M0C28_39615 [Candidatus Moduliflexus flocculans]|nr:hypothetical protein [Candidatus Moduliflexus flocculans]